MDDIVSIDKDFDLISPALIGLLFSVVILLDDPIADLVQTIFRNTIRIPFNVLHLVDLSCVLLLEAVFLLPREFYFTTQLPELVEVSIYHCLYYVELLFSTLARTVLQHMAQLRLPFELGPSAPRVELLNHVFDLTLLLKLFLSHLISILITLLVIVTFGVEERLRDIEKEFEFVGSAS